MIVSRSLLSSGRSCAAAISRRSSRSASSSRDPVRDVLIDAAFVDRGTRTEQRKRRQIGHAAEHRRLLERMQQFADREVVVAFGAIGGLQPAGSQRVEKDLAV